VHCALTLGHSLIAHSAESNPLLPGHWGLLKASVSDIFHTEAGDRYEEMENRLVFAPVTEMLDETMRRSREEMETMRRNRSNVDESFDDG